ncbi:hypothetical protein LTR10_024274 [Elasticomyces elasticus]|uniref:Carboxylic ester hydrolase n=1 Tax=Exophiala sideris TaxID=1016849 RepID=A0ABR0IVS0_9EURO|nr:hypothetical protein LTR10_024274 [Elasticomyces elasticus]KAK5021561.1 hypothetical protein LTS07_010858 [Exophiala sideris]KAK5024807.1 hypothetical protein LTR13_010776 [Exophiala sideris]KAK5049698.1 hypothetical protein LTR69_010882 [Exophiala sideris]KAK5176679.1 hypothetical protein LTR44_010749 [Eurotiomycetes sp. CCFEE 6388]
MTGLTSAVASVTEGGRSLSSRKGRFRISREDQGQHWRAVSSFKVEIFGASLAVIALMAIVVTLTIHQGRPLPQWPHMISINALIAIFTGVFRFSLLIPVAEGISRLKWLWFRQPQPLGDLERFDAASRGPWGSLKLVFRLRARQLATLGAFITVLSIGIDPFSQQILHYYDCNVLDAGSIALIPTSNFYTLGFEQDIDYQLPDASMTGVLYLGLIDPPANSSAGINADCVSGNCTFPQSSGASYSSIAMCSQCTDISSSIRNNSYGEGAEWYYTLPSGCEVGPFFGANGLGTVLNTMYVIKDSDSTNSSLFSFETLMTPDNSYMTASAFSCSLYPCVNTYAGNISNGILDERLVSSQRMSFYGSDGIFWFSSAMDRTLRNGTWSHCESSPAPMSPTNLCSRVGFTPYSSTSSERECWPNDCVWTLGLIPTGGIPNILDGLFDNQNVSYFGNVPQGPIWMLNLWNTGAGDLQHIQNTTAGLANAITAIMRQQGDNSSAGLVTGTVQALQTCIGVQWAWLSFPAAMLLLSIVFFLTATSKVSLSSMRNVWRSSSLTLLFHGLSKDVLLKDMDDGVSLEDAAYHVKGRLECLGDELAFTKVGAVDERSFEYEEDRFRNHI